jgi:GAF domain-containing protein
MSATAASAAVAAAATAQSNGAAPSPAPAVGSITRLISKNLHRNDFRDAVIKQFESAAGAGAGAGAGASAGGAAAAAQAQAQGIDSAANALTELYGTYQQFRELLTVTSSFAQSVNLDECIQHIVTHVAHICQSQCVFCYTVNQSSASLRLNWVFDATDSGVGHEFEALNQSIPLVDPHVATAAAAIRTGEVQIRNDYNRRAFAAPVLAAAAAAGAAVPTATTGTATSGTGPVTPHSSTASSVASFRIRNLACVPIRDQSGTIIAVLQVMNKTASPPSIIAAVANSAAAAVAGGGGGPPASRRHVETKVGVAAAAPAAAPPPALSVPATTAPDISPPAPYTDQDAAILKFIALIAGQTIQNARLHDDTLRMKKEQSVLFQVLKATENVAEVGVVIDILLDGCYEVLDAERIGLYFVDWVVRDLYMVRSADAQGFSMPLNKGLCGAVALSGKGFRVDDAVRRALGAGGSAPSVVCPPDLD